MPAETDQPRLYTRVYTPAEIAAWEAQNMLPPPAVSNPAVLRYWNNHKRRTAEAALGGQQ